MGGYCSAQSFLMDLIACWIDYFAHFSYSPARATRYMVMEGDELNELEEVKTIKKAILELG